MKVILYENGIVRENEFITRLIRKIDSIIDNCIRDSHNKYFHTFDHICVCYIKLTNNGNNEIISSTISGKSMNLYELNEKLTVATQKWFYI